MSDKIVHSDVFQRITTTIDCRTSLLLLSTKGSIPFVDLLSIRKDILIMWYYVFDIYDTRNPYVMGPFREYEDAASGCRSHEKVVKHNQPYRLAELNAQYH